MGIWGTTVQVVSILARATLAKIIGRDYTEELRRTIFGPAKAHAKQEVLEAIKEIRAGLTDPNLVGQVIQEIKREHPKLDEQMVELAVCIAPVDQLEKLATDPKETPEEATQAFRKSLPSPDTNTYLLWLNPPLLEADTGCFVHFSYAWNLAKKKHSFRLRDYIHRKIYWGVTKPSKEKQWEETIDRDPFSALDIWKQARKHIPAWSGYPDTTEPSNAKWTEILTELTKTKKPN